MKIQISQYIDHTNLNPTATPTDVENLCMEAVKFNFHSVCVSSFYVPLAHNLLKGTSVKLCSVAGFPLGTMSTEAKIYETDWSCSHGSNEIDVVANIGLLKSRAMTSFQDELTRIHRAAAKHGAILKVIIETCILSEEDIVLACKAVVASGAEFVKTSTGFSTGGANASQVRLMKDVVSDKISIKASGGIKSRQQALEMIDAGASRLGTSSSIDIVLG